VEETSLKVNVLRIHQFRALQHPFLDKRCPADPKVNNQNMLITMLRIKCLFYLFIYLFI